MTGVRETGADVITGVGAGDLKASEISASGTGRRSSGSDTSDRAGIRPRIGEVGGIALVSEVVVALYGEN